MRQHEAHGSNDVWGDPPQRLALGQCLTHQGELIMLKIPQPAMDQLGRRGRCAPAKIALLEQQDAGATTRGIARNATTVNSTANYRDIERGRLLSGQV
jgi:hypothetical protein